MSKFDYVAKRSTGESISGTMDADDETQIAQQLLNDQLYPISITKSSKTDVLENEVSLYSNSKMNRLRNQPVDKKDIMLFSRQMSILQKAGVPILSALLGLQQSSTKSKFEDMMSDIKSSLDSGRDLASTLLRHPKHFSLFYISMIRVGEMTGNLPGIFLTLYQYLQFEEETKNKVKAALRYPFFVIIAIAIAIAVTNIFVIPVFADVFKSFNAKLPILTQMLIGFSNFTVKYWWLIIISIGGSVYGFKTYINTSKGRYWWDRKKLFIPIAGPIILKTTMARFAGSLAMALKTGVPIAQSLSVVAQTLDNVFLTKRLENVLKNVERGESFYSSVRKSGVFPPVILQMISVGEESGSLDTMLADVAEMYNKETEYEIKGLSAAIEPILLFFVAVMVLLLALGIFLPLWNLGAAAKGA